MNTKKILREELGKKHKEYVYNKINENLPIKETKDEKVWFKDQKNVWQLFCLKDEKLLLYKTTWAKEIMENYSIKEIDLNQILNLYIENKLNIKLKQIRRSFN